MHTDLPIHVAVGVIENEEGNVLISKRSLRQDQGGLWEFPGGKIHQGESHFEALNRELKEELNINTLRSRPLITIHHQYSNYSVVLYVHKVIHWEDEPIGKEGQEIKWLEKESLMPHNFPEANKTIIKATQLPDTIFVTPEPSLYEERFFLTKIEQILKQGIKIIQFRCKKKKCIEHYEIIKKIKLLCEKFEAKLIINTDTDFKYLTEFDGLHLSSENLKKYDKRPISKEKLLMVSCHNDKEIEMSKKIDADALILGSVKTSNSHPNGMYLGWENFGAMTKRTNIPIYGIGGLNDDDKETAWNYGAQGIAMISGLWG